MALSILNNITSLVAQNQLNVTQSSLQKTLLQLSSGSNLFCADDAAGLAIADGLNANVTALTQLARNATDGVSLLQVADGAMSQVTTLLNRAVTLATESATGTVNHTQRVALKSGYLDQVGNRPYRQQHTLQRQPGIRRRSGGPRQEQLGQRQCRPDDGLGDEHRRHHYH